MLQAVRMLTEMARPSDDRSRGDAAGSSSDAQASLSTENQVVFREIHKNGWLRRTDTKLDKESSRCWVAFCVHDDLDPRLEGFTDQKHATSHSPIWFQTLRNALHLSPTLCATSKNDYEFCVNFSDDQILRLAAPTYQAMLDWVQVITRKLTDMKVLKPKENLYSRGPERIVTRDPTSPLPPPPSLATSSSRAAASSASPSTSSAPTVFTFDDVAAIEERLRPSSSTRQPGRAAPSVPLSPRLTGGATAAATTAANSNGGADGLGNSSYESVFLASSYPQTGDAVRTTNLPASRSHSSSDEGEQYAALIEYRTSDNPETMVIGSTSTSTMNTNSTSASSAVSTPVITVAPAPRIRQPRPQLTLREQQVMQLRKEMSHPAGVRFKLGRRDCKDGIAFVDCFGAVWIAGWKQKELPLLYNVLHIGDLVLSVAGIPLNGASSVRDILKNYTFPRVEMIVRRLPHGRVTTLTRRSESEDFGLEIGSVNEVLSVSTSAQALGLSTLTNAADPSVDVGTTVSWTLTEVNNRPLNVYEGNGRDRLVNALGRDVSVVLQPSDLMNAIKKKLRAVRSYKSFILQ
ncbi:uncharacterized protein LOC100677834 isoform X2 [Nasonia vitripennis]|uniref:PH domain-containing protein n=1 Tax=Nasonia vitripennis TaxID=7425 RepID=A0A7M7QV32_NASVI|nr:uncharacterized protein LOC100677834 isoform X2 [Nasonia vitripennis]XP_032455111.1 uncharacterized protein LOC100677834 isoform X2 [Nasonia vitripennis]